mmetsp:Transcript_42092/g.51060  ORF Transcript_42092/g.51060 Transcript_42092/m.51060 type:complete len:208 (-) Transcript_42092:292-915(-)|eukprot:CAMPEP_0197856766 /NCGR_PEP_ID=MMETSP1438-20131217/29210_1 /TAXON_ID=1461541 /ORGANISM="Pterosperma sp., Strain CCMP1384" /LENGTH=207 /DNA_ID=CAMNT_0043472343 /DNA_START=384 /DNA_END=1007 /DNA_ORIENTATION=-
MVTSDGMERSKEEKEMSKEKVVEIAKMLKAYSAMKALKNDSKPARIADGIYLGSIGAASSKDTLKALSITHILCVASAIQPKFPEDFNYKTVAVLDSPTVELSEYFEECFEYINKVIAGGEALLVHCFAGKSRSATIVLAWLMKHKQFSLEDAIAYTKSCRDVINPNAGFMQQLAAYDRTLKAGRGTVQDAANTVNPVDTAVDPVSS